MTRTIGTHELAKRLARELSIDVHPQTLRRWTDQGILTAAKTAGGHLRFDPVGAVQEIRQHVDGQPGAIE